MKAGAAVTVKASGMVISPASGFVKVRLRVETAAEEATVTFTVSEVALLKVTLFTVTPVPLNEAVMPFTKPMPATDRFWLVARWPLEAGVSEVKAGAVVTVKTEAASTKPPSGFVNVKARAEAVAEADTSTLTVREVALWKVTLFTAMPVPLNDAVIPFTKPVPTMARF